VLLDALDLSDHAEEVAMNVRAPSILSPAPGSTRSPSTTSPKPLAVGVRQNPSSSW
jgi:hypothetical protein